MRKPPVRSIRRGSPSRALFSTAIAGLPTRRDESVGVVKQMKPRARSVFERLDFVPKGLPAARQAFSSRHPHDTHGPSAYPYNVGPARRITIEEGHSSSGRRSARGQQPANEWPHDRFDGGGVGCAPLSTVFVRGLAKDTSESKLMALFEGAGCRVCMIKVERAPLTTAVVGFTRRDAAPKAIEALHGSTFMGSTIRIMLWDRDEEGARKAIQERQLQDRMENDEIRKELQAMQSEATAEARIDWAVSTSGTRVPASRRQITMAHQTPKRSVFERVS